MLSRLVLSVVLLSSFSTLLPAQGFQHQPGRRQGAVQPAPQQTQIQGTIEGVMRGVIAVVDGNNQQWRVAVPADAKISVTGTATVDFLRSGLFVELQAELDDHGTVKEKIDELTIVTPSQDRPVGLFPAGAAAGGDQDGFGAGMENAPGGRTAKRGKAAAGAYRIVGRLSVGRGGKYSVQAGRGTVKFELTEEPKIKVDLADYTVAAKGDKVSIEAVTTPARPGFALANKVEIELAEPLTGVKKKQPIRPSGKHTP